MIPKILHQVWVGDKQRPTEWMDTWEQHHPDWEYILWDDEKVAAFPFTNRRHIDVLMAEKKYHGVADIVRYEVLYVYGGVAMPADSECVRPIDELLDIGDDDCFTCYENEVHYPGRLTPVLGATKNNELMRRLIEELKVKSRVIEPWIDSGNMLLTEVAQTYERVKIYPSYYFMPNHRLGGNYDGKSPYYSKQYSGTTFNLYKPKEGKMPGKKPTKKVKEKTVKTEAPVRTPAISVTEAMEHANTARQIIYAIRQDYLGMDEAGKALDLLDEAIARMGQIHGLLSEQ